MKTEEKRTDTLASDPVWVRRGLEFWTGQVNEHPKNRVAKWNLDWFKKFAADLGI